MRKALADWFWAATERFWIILNHAWDDWEVPEEDNWSELDYIRAEPTGDSYVRHKQ